MAFERALAKQPKTDVPDGARCYVCLDGGDVLRGCACRGPSAGFAHAGCLAEMAARDEWMFVDGWPPLSRWFRCVTCHQTFTRALGIEMDRRRWRHHREAPVSSAKYEALAKLAGKLVRHEEFDVAERLYDEARRGVPLDNDTVQQRLILPSEIDRVSALLQVGRFRDALEILSRFRPSLGLCLPKTRAEYYRYMGFTLGGLGRLEEALPFAAEAVELARTSEGPQSFDALDAMDMQAWLFSQVGRVEEAKAALTHILALNTRVFGPDHENTRHTRDTLESMSTRS